MISRNMNLDGQLVEGGCDSNVNQRTIGGVCTRTCPDPSCGTYIGHGSQEGNGHNGEGNYYNAENGCTACKPTKERKKERKKERRKERKKKKKGGGGRGGERE